MVLTLVAIFGLTLGLASSAGESCSVTDTIDTDLDWYGYLSRFTYKAKAGLEFSYDIRYRYKDSQEYRTANLLLYEDQHITSNMADDLTCQEKVNLEKDGAPLNKFIELSPEDYWSGCREDPQTRWLVCKGGRSYKVQNETTLITAISRCGAEGIRMEYTLIFSGYTGECPGQLTNPDTKHYLPKEYVAIIVVCVVNTVLLITVVTYVACRKLRLLSMNRQSRDSRRGMVIMNNSYEE